MWSQEVPACPTDAPKSVIPAELVLDTMITSLAELLEDKGVITQKEWEQSIKNNLKT